MYSICGYLFECARTDPCDQLSCPSHATCEKVLIQFISPSGFYAAFCLPSCDMENGGCAEEEICSLVEQICPADAPCPPTVRCSPKGKRAAPIVLTACYVVIIYLFVYMLCREFVCSKNYILHRSMWLN